MPGCEGDRQVARPVLPHAAGPADPQGGSGRQAAALVRQERRVRGDHRDDRPHSFGQVAPRQGNHAAVEVPTDRIPVDDEPPTGTVVGLDENSERVGGHGRVRRSVPGSVLACVAGAGPTFAPALNSTDDPRRRADTALETVADHSCSAADVALGDGTGTRPIESRPHVAGRDMGSVDVVEQPVPCLGHDGQRPPVRSRPVRPLDLHEGVAHHPHRVRVREGDRRGQQP